MTPAAVTFIIPARVHSHGHRSWSRGGSLRRHKAGPVTVHSVFRCFLSVLVSFYGCCSSCGQGRKSVGATPLVLRGGGR